MANKKKEEEAKAGAPEWMTTYGDMVTLLMCFFVLLFAFSSIDKEKFEQVMKSFRGSAGVLESGKSLTEDELIFDASPENKSTPDSQDERKEEIVKTHLNELAEELIEEIEEQLQKEAEDGEENEFKDKSIEELVEFIIEDDKLIIRLKDNVLFDSGQAEIKSAALTLLKVIGEVLQEESFVNSDIKIEGHTDNVPMYSALYPSNWELSAGRAASVLKYLRDELGYDEKRLSISGYADMKPIGDNSTKEGRAMNRRVEIIVENLEVKDLSNEQSEGE